MSDYPTEYLACRILRHRWEDQGARDIRRSGGRIVSFVRELRCDRCGTTKEQDVSLATGQVEASSRFRYPRDYVRAGGVDAVALQRQYVSGQARKGRERA